MTDQEQNIAVAEACGWHHFIINDEYGNDRALRPTDKAVTGCVFTDLPNYGTDLNAMHEAEKFMMHKQWPKYVTQLARVIAIGRSRIRDDDTRVSVPTNMLLAATAAQRREAFLRTIGKWKE